MRTLSSNALTQINTAMGTKPMILLEIGWVDLTPVSKYADKTVGAYLGKILSIGTIDEIIKIAGGSNSGQVSVTLDDIDGTLKDIIDNHDIHKRPVWIYQYFEGMSTNDKFLLMRGEISSPITWDEGARSLAFDVLTKIESTEIGFSIEEGQFPLLPIDLVGKAWPLAFGSVVNVPALKITSPREGILADGFGIHDYTLRRRIQLANNICCPANSIIGYDTNFGLQPGKATANTNPNTGLPSNQASGFSTTPNFITTPDPGFSYANPFGYQIIDGTGQIGGGGGVVNGTSAGTGTGVSSVPVYGPDPACIKNRCETIEQLNYELTQQQKFEFTSFRVFNGQQFEQGKRITLSIGGAYVVGSFSGDVFTVQQYIHKDAVDKDLAKGNNYTDRPTQAEIDFILNQVPGRTQILTSFGSENPADAVAAYHASQDAGPASILSSCTTPAGTFVSLTDCESQSLDSLNLYPSASFQWVNAGSKVTYAYDEEVVYIANILPSTVRCVTAYRTLDDGRRVLLVVPPDYYTVRTTDYTAYHVVEIVMNRALSLQATGWEDQIYVTLDSSVGPNTVDIIQWLIQTYTTFDIDSTSFAAVRAKVDNYPSHFALLDRKNIMAALDEISMQARCAMFLRDNKFYIKYLSASPTTVDTITEDHINQNSLRITNSTTEELVTKMVVTWNDDLAISPKTLIVRNNINKYGTIEQTFDFYIYNMYSLVEKSALFWLIRKSNTWRRMSFKTPLVKLALESYDDVLFTVPDLSSSNFKGQVEGAVFNADDNSISFDVWTPILAGTRVEYPWAYPGTVNASQLWPPDIVAQGPGFSVVAPVGHPLSSTTFPNNVPDDATAPNFQVTNCGGPPTPNTNFCCSSTATVQPSEFCQTQHPRRIDDANDVKPSPRTDINCPGAVNLGKDPVFAQLPPKFARLQKQVNQSQSQAASAKAAALNAGGGAGGGGGLGNQDDSQQKSRTDPLDKVPRVPKNNATGDGKGAGGPTPKPTCTTLITICWFPIVHGPDGPFSDICFPGGNTRCETHTFGGCVGSTRRDITSPEALAAATAKGEARQAAFDALNAAAAAPGDAGLQAAADAAVAASTEADAAYDAAIQKQGAAQDMLDHLRSMSPLSGPGATNFELCPSSDETGICCNGTVQTTECDPTGCSPGASDGKWMSVDKTGSDGKPAEFSSILFDGQGGDRGADGQSDSEMGFSI